MRNGRVYLAPSVWDGLEPRCATCREELDYAEATLNLGDLLFHVRCAPACAVCTRLLESEQGGWRLEGEVVSEPWGWSVRPTRFWCRACLESVPRDRPAGQG